MEVFRYSIIIAIEAYLKKVTNKQRFLSLLYDYLCIVLYLIILLVNMTNIYFLILREIPEFYHAESQLIAFLQLFSNFNFLQYLKQKTLCFIRKKSKTNGGI